jgi:hypothetical protein
MSPWKKVRTYVLVAVMLAGGLAVGERVGVPGVHGLIAAAEAVVGRPLTPVSVAGVARRTARRCAVGVYYC